MWLKMNNPFHNKYELLVYEIIKDTTWDAYILHCVPLCQLKVPDHSHDHPRDDISIYVLLPKQGL